MSIDNHIGKGYWPLPQSISNTDTEDEEERLSQLNDNGHKDHYETTTTSSSSLQRNGVYYPLDETRNFASRTRNGQNVMQYSRDDIPIMVIEENTQNDLWKRRDMSPIRRFCLVSSILLCIATILVFLYVLPCDDSVVCPPVIEPRSSISWDKILQGVELHGPISVVPGSPYNLIFLLRGQQYGINDTSSKNARDLLEENGAISMRGDTGLPLWRWRSLKRIPTDIDCISLDTDRSGSPDCIVVGDHGLLVSIDPTAGTTRWNSGFYTFSKLPLILPDIDADGIEDLLSVEIVAESMPCIILLSGASGQLLGRYETPNNCSSLDIYDLVSNGSVTYVCHEVNGKRVNKFVSLKVLLTNINSTDAKRSIVLKSLTAPRFFITSQHNNEKFTWRPTPYHYLNIENEGTCPGELCRFSVNLTLKKVANQSLTIWDHVSSNSFASKPAFLINLGQPYTTGFAIKFWQWVNVTTENTEPSHLVERRLIETVLIIFVNYTNVQVINASQSNVTQLCNGMECQPNLNSRTHFSSIAIAYISDDGLPELISYWSSYDMESSKILTSKVQVVKLDSITSNISRP